ncbi:MAG: CBS domain-containing protein [Tepidisphaeraceae bacterium]
MLQRIHGGDGRMVVSDDIQMASLDREAIPLLVVNEMVRHDLPVVKHTDDLGMVLEAFSRHEVSHLPVTMNSRPNHVIGLISRAGLMRRYQQMLAEAGGTYNADLTLSIRFFNPDVIGKIAEKNRGKNSLLSFFSASVSAISAVKSNVTIREPVRLVRNAAQSDNDQSHPIRSRPFMCGRNASGIVIEPSAF